MTIDQASDLRPSKTLDTLTDQLLATLSQVEELLRSASAMSEERMERLSAEAQGDITESVAIALRDQEIVEALGRISALLNRY